MASCSLGAARGLTHLVGMVTGAHLGGGCGAQHRGWGQGRQAQKAGQGQGLQRLQAGKGGWHRGRRGPWGQAGQPIGQRVHAAIQLCVVEVLLAIALLQFSLPPAGLGEQREMKVGLKQKPAWHSCPSPLPGPAAPQVHQADVSLHPRRGAQHLPAALPQALEQPLQRALGNRGRSGWAPPTSTPPQGPPRLTFLFLSADSPNRKWAASGGSGGDGVDGEDWSLAGSQPPPLPGGCTGASLQGSRHGSVDTHGLPCQDSGAQAMLPTSP